MPYGSNFRMKKAVIGAAACALFGALNLAAQGEQIFRGEVCLGPTAHTATLEKSQVTAQCNFSRVKWGAKFVLYNPDNKTVYQLGGHKKVKPFAGANVVVTGTLNKTTGTINVSDIFGALPPKVTRAKSVFIECDACPRGMAVAWRAAFEELTDWGRFDVTPDAKKADLIFVISANPYLGDYLTRDGPDKRDVAVKITFMDIVDPTTGRSLWADSREWGSLLVTKATKSLITEFRDRLEIEESIGKS
jgi:hypothetical protein